MSNYKQSLLTLVATILAIPTVPASVTALIDHQKEQITDLMTKLDALSIKYQEAIDESNSLSEEDMLKLQHATDQLSQLASSTQEISIHLGIHQDEIAAAVANVPPQNGMAIEQPPEPTADDIAKLAASPI